MYSCRPGGEWVHNPLDYPVLVLTITPIFYWIEALITYLISYILYLLKVDVLCCHHRQ